ncbi:hypothetical protein BC332_18177 [Capsicum chinense]|nr:hypothetical protein BC332_18177 [Capsicum chinense]
MDEHQLYDANGDESWTDGFGNPLYAESDLESEDEEHLEIELEREDSEHPQIELENEDGMVSDRYLLDVMSNPALIRNVALVGHWCHGKTEFVHAMMSYVHHVSTLEQINERRICTPYTRIYSDTRLSYRLHLASLILSDNDSTSYLCNILDCPGHVDFSDEMTFALRLADGAILLVDAVQGVMVNTERAIRHAIQKSIPIVLVINKVDRLITKLKLTPKDAYFKLKHIVETVNDQIIAASSTTGNSEVIDPALGNACFASAKDAWFFTLQSFAKLKVTGNQEIDAVFVVDTGFTDMLVHHIPSAKDAAIRKVEHIYTGPKNSTIYKAMEDSDSTGPLMVNVTGMYIHSGVLGRVYSGKIMTGHTVRVLRAEDKLNELMTVKVTKLWVLQACCKIPESKATPGSLVLIGGVDDAIEKTASLCNLESDEDAYKFRLLQFNTFPVVKIAFSLLNGWTLDDISEGLRKIIRSYPIATLRVEKSGVCTISGTGELYLKFIMEDVRQISLDKKGMIIKLYSYRGTFFLCGQYLGG